MGNSISADSYLDKGTPGKIDHEFERYTWSNWDGLGEPTDTPLKRTWRPPGITEKLPGSHKVPYAAGDTSRMGSWNGNWTGVIERRTVDLAVDGPEGSAYAGLGLGVGLGMFMSIVIVVLVLTLGFRRGAAANRVRGRGRDLEARKEIGGEDLVGSFEDLMEGADDGYDSKEC
ncbi:hypothetical protein QTJ16_005169 [Diplocarpon rosae]|uniref:Uncharacterized protein n=1 Tax=Diplocarpon rosae TaxID=946125 RepID=A0AAD9SYH5_9HELO|nr:hypothetical protein QTJ16_005169 [Diplocarpon rosae]